MADLAVNYYFWLRNETFFLFFELIIVITASKYIRYDIKIVVFRKCIFQLLFIFQKLQVDGGMARHQLNLIRFWGCFYNGKMQPLSKVQFDRWKIFKIRGNRCTLTNACFHLVGKYPNEKHALYISTKLLIAFSG